MRGFVAWRRQIGEVRWHVHESTAEARHASPTVVFVPGLGEGDYMAPHGRELAEHWRVLIPDMPGFGRTRGPSRLSTVEDFADALDEFVRTLEVPPFVVASSFGAQITVAAAAAGAPIAKLVLVSPTYDDAARSVLGQVRRWLPTMFVEPPTLALGLTKSYAHCGVRTPILAFLAGLYYPTEECLPKIDAPVLVVRGARDRIVSAPWAEKLASLAPNGSLATIDGYAHTLDFAAPRELAAVTIPFLDR